MATRGTTIRWSKNFKPVVAPGGMATQAMPETIKTLPHGAVITAQVVGNPKKRGSTAAYDKYEFKGVQGATVTLADYIRKLGSATKAYRHIAWDVNKGFVTVQGLNGWPSATLAAPARLPELKEVSKQQFNPVEAKREFRTQASLTAEQKSRDAVAPFLRSRGFVVEEELRPKTGVVESQFVKVIDPHGSQLHLHVRLCWRQRGEGGLRYSAAQLRANLVDGDWDKTMRSIEDRDASRGVSHTLLVQSVDGNIDIAALIATEAISPIWKGQRDVCAKLIAEGKLGGIKKNINENGNSPTLYLMDARTLAARQITDVLWNWPGVLDIAKLQFVLEKSDTINEDTDDDLDIDLSLLGSDGTARFVTAKSGVKRDPAVRRAVAQRATSGCERASCSDDRRYVGFLDVHHIFGAEKSDRAWTCVALCPNCHRAAHFAPDRDKLNEEFLKFASQFRPATRT